jgi:acetyl-CoA acetyltransferase
VTNPPNDGTPAAMTPPALFSLLAPAYFKKYGLDPDKGKDVLSRIAWKNHRNGARNPKAQFQKEVPLESIKNSPKIADPLGIMDCSGVSDGSAAAIVVRAEDAHKYCKNPIYIKAYRSWPGRGKARSRRSTISPRSPKLSLQRVTPTRRPESPTRASRLVSPKFTTALLRPSSCCAKTSDSARVGPRGRT